jgi:hypothetical protein
MDCILLPFRGHYYTPQTLWVTFTPLQMSGQEVLAGEELSGMDLNNNRIQVNLAIGRPGKNSVAGTIWAVANIWG